MAHNYTIKKITFSKAREIATSSKFDALFQGQFAFNSSFFSKDEVSKEQVERSERHCSYNDQDGFGFLAMDGDEIVGYTYAHALNYNKGHGEHNSLYMDGSGVLKPYQGQGIYKSLVQSVIEEAKAQGYTLIMSEHNATNNNVIVPKLKAGFVIVGTNIRYNGGTFVKLAYPLCEKVSHAFDVRSGFESPTEDLKKSMKI